MGLPVQSSYDPGKKISFPLCPTDNLRREEAPSIVITGKLYPKCALVVGFDVVLGSA